MQHSIEIFFGAGCPKTNSGQHIYEYWDWKHCFSCRYCGNVVYCIDKEFSSIEKFYKEELELHKILARECVEKMKELY